MASKIRRIKHGPGNYQYYVEGKPERTVAVFTRDGNPDYGDPAVMWIAAAEWGSDLFSDPVYTMREAVEAATTFLTEAWANPDAK